ncbi:MAG TPA: hypothetical protein VN936_01900 [Candidatus Acidoferrum sp.]|nr:hypothetical protein [Candidatus Acidoferrum sp.]
MRTVIALSVLVLAGCTNAAQSPVVPPSSGGPAVGSLARQQPAAYSNGIYVAEFNNNAVFAYANQNRRNAPPVCGENGIQIVADVGTDPAGDLMVPSQIGELIYVFGGPKLCGAEIAKLHDSYGLPVDVASRNAASGTIAVANEEDNGPISNPPPGSITLCTVSAGCTANLTNKAMYRVAGVVMDNSGNCWASAFDVKKKAALVYFAGCTGAGRLATGFKNTSYGGLDIDSKGNILSIDYQSRDLFVYSGCNPDCIRVAGPLALHDAAIYGKVNSTGTLFATADYNAGSVDVYRYDGKSIKFEYSFNQDLDASSVAEGIAFSPSD